MYVSPSAQIQSRLRYVLLLSHAVPGYTFELFSLERMNRYSDDAVGEERNAFGGGSGGHARRASRVPSAVAKLSFVR